MRRLTKAAVATGGAAVLLLAGGGTVAYWTAQGTATGTALDSGSLTVTNGTCGAWQYTTADGGGAVDAVVPGDTVQTDCTLTVSGTGSHLGVTASLNGDPTFAETNALVSAMTLTVGDVMVDSTPVPTDPTQGVNISTPGTHTITVTVTADFPYGDATTTSLNDTENLTATLDDVTVSVVQTHTPA